MKSHPDCAHYKIDKEIVLKENRSKITFLNPHQEQILVVRIDGCMVKDERLRCDYGLVPWEGVEIYVELKGSDIDHAIKQLESSINILSESPQKTPKLCFIVSTRVPRQTTTAQKLQIYFKRKFNAQFRIKNIQDKYDLRDCRKSSD